METRAAETHKGWKESDYNLAISANLRSLAGASCLFKVKSAYVPGSKLLILKMVIPRLIGNLHIFVVGYNGYINHPPIIGLMSLSPTIWIQNGSLDPFAHIEDMEMVGFFISQNKYCPQNLYALI